MPVEQRTKARMDKAHPPQQEEPISSPSPAIPRQVPLSTRTVSTGRRIDFNFLEKEEFGIGRKIKEMGWEYLCSLDVPSFPNLVREFYGNVEYDKGGIVLTIKGTPIMVY